MIYKIYNESPEVGTAAKTLKYVIYYNVCNMIEWGTRRAQMCIRGNTPYLMPTRTPERAQKIKNGLQTNCSP